MRASDTPFDMPTGSKKPGKLVTPAMSCTEKAGGAGAASSTAASTGVSTSSTDMPVVVTRMRETEAGTNAVAEARHRARTTMRCMVVLRVWKVCLRPYATAAARHLAPVMQQCHYNTCMNSILRTQADAEVRRT